MWCNIDEVVGNDYFSILIPRQHCAGRNEALQKLHTEQSLLLTARWKQNKITWQLLCSTLVQTVISLLVNRLQKHESSIKRHRDTPLESNFLNFCVAISWWSGSSEKIIWIISAVMTPSCTNASESSCLVQTTAQQTYRREAAYTYSCDGYCGADVWILDRTFLHGVISWRYADISSLEQLQSYRHTLNKCTDAQMKGCRRRRWSEQRCSLNIVKKSRLKMETEKNQDQSKERNTNQSKNKSSAKSMLSKHTDTEWARSHMDTTL